MARIQSKWYRPYTLTPNRMGTFVAVTLRRWHPAWIVLAVRMIEPRELWRPVVWWAIARAYWRIGR